jgi:succinate dehydrogenase/fumarate reductase flavoprotein subunit
MAGHMLGASQVFGKIAGRYAAAETVGQTLPEPAETTIKAVVDEITALREMKKSEKPANVTKDVQKLTWENMLVHITEDLLDQAREGISDIKKNRLENLNVETPQDLIDALELRNLVLVGEILNNVTQMRKESRGDLYREDYPERDDLNWAKVIKVQQQDGEMHLRTEVIDPDWGKRQRSGDMLDIHWG